MKLNRERFLAAAMMLGTASGVTTGCKSGSEKSQIGAESNQGPANEGVGRPSWEGNAGGLRPANEGGIVAPNREGFAPPGFNPTREAGFVAPTKEGTVVPPAKESAVNPPGWTGVNPGTQQPVQQPAGRPPVTLPKIKGR